ncbi:MAG: hypothetical protein QXM38_03045 [Candidatus Aenigmatarchaeota archaeon]
MAASDIWPVVIILLLTIVLPIIVILLTTAGPSFWSSLGIFVMMGSILIALLVLSGGLILLGVIIAYQQPRTGRILAYIGIGGVLLGLLFLESSIALRTAKDRLSETYVFENCKNIPVTFGDVKSISDTLSCIITGYYSKDSSPYYLIGYWIFGVVVPLLLTSGIFLDLVESAGIITNSLSRKIIGWSLGFLAYRGLVVSNLVYIIDFASAGMVIIVLNFIFVGGLLAYTNRMFSQWQHIETAIEFGKATQVARVNARRILDEAIKQLKGNANVDTVFNNLLSPFKSDFELVSRQGWLKIEAARTANQSNPQGFLKALLRIKNNYYK